MEYILVYKLSGKHSLAKTVSFSLIGGNYG